MEDDNRMEVALWRYGIISPLLHRDANALFLCDMVQTLAQSSYVRPWDRQHVSISPETIRKWLYRYNHGGLAALANKPRSDKGCHKVPKPIVEAMFELRKQHPRWSIALLLQRLVELDLWDQTTPSRSALYRFAKAHNLMRDPHLTAHELIRPFAFDKFGQMWIADFMHGPKLWAAKKKRKSYLHVIIDDCTRFVVSGRFYRSESTQSLIVELMTATRRHGIAQRLYTDNGAAYNSRHLKIVCANLGLSQPHTPPRRPRGRGKVERFFKTVRDQFLAKQHYKSFDEINRVFIDFLHNYHNRIHSTLKCTPMQKRLSTDSVCRKVPEMADIESLFRLKRRCKVQNDGTIRLAKKCFEVPGCLPGSRVTICFMPWDMTRIYYGDDMRMAREVDLNANANRFVHPNFNRLKEDHHDTT